MSDPVIINSNLEQGLSASLGGREDVIQTFQALLREQHLYSGLVDGKPSDALKDAITAFQKNESLTPQQVAQDGGPGVIGSNTYALLMGEFATSHGVASKEALLDAVKDSMTQQKAQAQVDADMPTSWLGRRFRDVDDTMRAAGDMILPFGIMDNVAGVADSVFGGSIKDNIAYEEARSERVSGLPRVAGDTAGTGLLIAATGGGALLKSGASLLGRIWGGLDIAGNTLGAGADILTHPAPDEPAAPTRTASR